MCFIISKISEKNSAYKGINKFIDASLENILYRRKSAFGQNNISVLTYRIKDAFSNFEEVNSKELRPLLNIQNSSVSILNQFYDHLKSISMKIVQFETDFKDYHKLLRTQKEEIIPVSSLKKDDRFKGVKIMSEGKNMVSLFSIKQNMWISKEKLR